MADRGITILYRSVFLIVIILVLVQQFWGYKIENALWERDRLSKNSIRPRFYGLLIRLSFFICWLGALVLMICDRNDTFLAMLLIVFIGFASLCVNTYATRLSYTDTYIRYVRFRKERKIPWEDVEKLRWEDAPRGLGFVLVIYLQSGEKILLNQSVFVGLRMLENAYIQHKTQ